MTIHQLGEKISRDMSANNCGGLFVITDLEIGGHLCGGHIPSDFDFVADQISALVYDLAKKFNISQDQVLSEVIEHVNLRKQLGKDNPDVRRNLH